MDTPKPKPRCKCRCAREGCKRGVRDGYRCCSYLCNVITDRIEQAERMCKALGPGHTSTAMWVAAVELGDALTLEQKLETRMYREAMAQGFTAEQWSCGVGLRGRSPAQGFAGQQDQSVDGEEDGRGQRFGEHGAEGALIEFFRSDWMRIIRGFLRTLRPSIAVAFAGKPRGPHPGPHRRGRALRGDTCVRLGFT